MYYSTSDLVKFQVFGIKLNKALMKVKAGF